MPSVRKTKRRPSISRRARIVALVCTLTALVLLFGGMYMKHQEVLAANAAEAATYTPAAVAPTDGATAGPSATAAAPAPKITIPADPRLLIMGDSYTAGVGASTSDLGWATLVTEELGYPSQVDGVGGTGFAWGGGTDDTDGREYSERLEEVAAGEFYPNLLILQGGQNDSLLNDQAVVTDAVTATIEQARDLWPDVQVVVMGPSAPLPLAVDLKPVSAAVEAGAKAAGAPFINPSGEGWFTSQNSPGFDSDGSHVNDDGHALIAREFLADWAIISG